MLNNVFKKRFIIFFITIIIIIIVYLMPSKNKNEEYISLSNDFDYIYLLNNKKMLVKVSIVSSNNNLENKIKEIISSLTINSNTLYYSNNLKPIIPENTKLLDIELKDELLKINFSKELLSVSMENEEKLIESIIYSLTELNEIKKIMIFVDGESLLKLPNSNKELPIILTRDYGINKIYNIKTIASTSKYTLYYFTNIDDSYHIVPVTLFTNDSDDKIEVIIKNLKSSSIYQTDLVSFLNNNIKLLDYEIKENKVKLNFNNYLLDNFYDDSLVEEVKYAISQSIKDSLNIDDISMLVNGFQI